MFADAVSTILDETMGDVSNDMKAIQRAEFLKSNNQMASGF